MYLLEMHKLFYIQFHRSWSVSRMYHFLRNAYFLFTELLQLQPTGSWSETCPGRIGVSYFISNLNCKVFLIIDGKIFKNLWNNYRNYVRFLRTINESIFYMGIPVFWKSEIKCTKSILFLYYINTINISFCNRNHFVSTPCKMKTESVEFLSENTIIKTKTISLSIFIVSVWNETIWTWWSRL